MKKYATRKGEQKLFDEGYRFHSYEYDWDAQREVRRLEDKGYDVALLREKTDTAGLKMFSVWLKPIEGGDEHYLNASINIKGNKMKKRAGATFDEAKEMAYEIMESAQHFEPWPMYVDGDFHKSDVSGVWIIEFEIEGDWKHDHLSFDIQVEELYPFLLNKGERVVDEDGSDYYTAVHRFAFAGKDVDLNTMSRLFASKKGKNAMKNKHAELHNFVPRQYFTIVNYELRFEDDTTWGYVFPCDENGNVYPDISDTAKKNLEFALAHPEMFPRCYNKVVRHEYDDYDVAHGTCDCGEEVYLYGGDVECECGRWYNAFGQEIKPPQYWYEDDIYDDDSFFFEGAKTSKKVKKALKKRAKATCLYRDDFRNGVFGEVFFAPSMDENERYYWSVTYDGNVIADGFCATEEEAFDQLERNIIYASKSAMNGRTSSKSKSMKKRALEQDIVVDGFRFTSEISPFNGMPMYSCDIKDEHYSTLYLRVFQYRDCDFRPGVFEGSDMMAVEHIWESFPTAEDAARYLVSLCLRKGYIGESDKNASRKAMKNHTSSRSKKIVRNANQKSAMKKRAEMTVHEMVSYLEQMGHQNGSDEWELGPVRVQDNFGDTEEVYAKIEEIGDMKYKVRYYYNKKKEYRGQMDYWQDDVASIMECARTVLQIIAEHLGYDYF